MNDSENSNRFSKQVVIKDAFREDSIQGGIRIDSNIAKKLKLRNGDVIEISNPISKKKTAALLFPSRREDKGMGIIRLDTFLRRNIDAILDDYVWIRKIKAALAEKVTFVGLTEYIKFNPRLLNSLLDNRVVTKDDIVGFGSSNKKFDLVVIDFLPKTDAVRIHLATKITISEKNYDKMRRDRDFSEELNLGNKALRDHGPKNAVKHYKMALNNYNGYSKGNIFCRIATAYVHLTFLRKDMLFLTKAEKYFQKAQSYLKEQNSIVEKNLEELKSFKNDPEALKKYVMRFED